VVFGPFAVRSVHSPNMGITLLRQRVGENRSPNGQAGKAVTVDVTQSGNRLTIQADHIEVFFAVEGIDLPPNTDPLASCLFLLSDLFEQGTLAADSTHAEGMLWFPWGSNRVTNAYFVGSDFSVRTVGAEATRTEKIMKIIAAGIDPQWLSFCRKRGVFPDNCGTCRKCARTKAMFLAATGSIPQIFRDNGFDEALFGRMIRKSSDRAHLFDIYFCAQDRGTSDKIPGLATMIDEFRESSGEGLVRRR